MIGGKALTNSWVFWHCSYQILWCEPQSFLPLTSPWCFVLFTFLFVFFLFTSWNIFLPVQWVLVSSPSQCREEAFYLEKCCPLLQEAGAVHVGGRSMCWTVDFTKRTDCEFTSNLCELLLLPVVVVVASSMPLCTSQNVQNRGRNILLKDLKKYFVKI